jgi:hypothetical protein
MERYQIINYVADAAHGDEAAAGILELKGWGWFQVDKGTTRVIVPAEDRKNDRVVELEHIRSEIIERDVWIGIDADTEKAFYWLP